MVNKGNMDVVDSLKAVGVVIQPKEKDFYVVSEKIAYHQDKIPENLVLCLTHEGQYALVDKDIYENYGLGLLKVSIGCKFCTFAKREAVKLLKKSPYNLISLEFVDPPAPIFINLLNEQFDGLREITIELNSIFSGI